MIFRKLGLLASTDGRSLGVFALCVLSLGCASSVHGQSLSAPAYNPSESISDIIEKAKQNGPESIYFVEQIAQAKATQAIPMLETKFQQTQDEMDKGHVASALVRLGDQNDAYWDFLLKLATPAAESDMPEFLDYDAAGKAKPGPSPAMISWARAHNISPQSVGEDALYWMPGRLAFLAMTGDPRGLPLLRKALLSPNLRIRSIAARGLAQAHDMSAVPLIVDACRKSPHDAAAEIAKSLVYFDDPNAQKTVDIYVPQEIARDLRNARAGGKTPF